MTNENNLFENVQDMKGAPISGAPASSQEQPTPQSEGVYAWQEGQTPPPVVPTPLPEGVLRPEHEDNEDPIIKEKKSAKRGARIAGVSFVVFQVLSMLLSYICLFVMVGMGFSVVQAIEYMMDGLFAQVFQILAATFLFTVPFIIVAKIGKIKIGAEVPYCRPKKGTAIPFFFIGVSFCAFANIATSVLSNFFKIFGIEHPNIDIPAPDGIAGIILVCISTVAVPALVEEFACRGIVFAALKPQGEGVAIFVSALLFGLMHGNFIQIPFAFLVGLVLGYVRVKTGTLWICCAIHAANNAISVFFDYMFADNTELQNAIFMLYIVISLLMGILGVLMLSNKKSDEDFFKLNKGKYKSSAFDRTRWVILSPFVITFTFLALINALAAFLEI